MAFLRDVARAARVSQHLLVHGLLCSPLVRVLLHQLGQLGVDGLGNKQDQRGTVSGSLVGRGPGRGRRRNAVPGSDAVTATPSTTHATIRAE